MVEQAGGGVGPQPRDPARWIVIRVWPGRVEAEAEAAAAAAATAAAAWSAMPQPGAVVIRWVGGQVRQGSYPDSQRGLNRGVLQSAACLLGSWERESGMGSRPT